MTLHHALPLKNFWPVHHLIYVCGFIRSRSLNNLIELIARAVTYNEFEKGNDLIEPQEEGKYLPVQLDSV